MIQLNPRERQLALGLGLFVGALLLYNQVVKRIQVQHQNLTDIIPQKQMELAEVQDRAQALDDITAKQQALEQRLAQQSQSDLMPYLEQLIRRLKLDAFVTERKQQPSRPLAPDIEESLIKISWDNIVLKDLLDFLAVIDAPDNLCRVQQLHIQYHPDETTRVDASTTIARPQRIKG